jgi:hypothetical protein
MATFVAILGAELCQISMGAWGSWVFLKGDLSPGVPAQPETAKD